MSACDLRQELCVAGSGRSSRHLHACQDNYFYVLQGRIAVHDRYSGVDLGPGQSWCVPAGDPHYFVVLEPAVFIETYTHPRNPRTFLAADDIHRFDEGSPV